MARSWGCAFAQVFLQVQEHRGGLPTHVDKTSVSVCSGQITQSLRSSNCFLRVKMHGGAFLEIIEKAFSEVKMRGGALPENRAEIGLFIFECFQDIICFFEVARRYIGTFSRHAIGFQIIFHPAGLVGHKKMSFLDVVVTLFSL